jgi:DNA topoisomerase-1
VVETIDMDRASELLAERRAAGPSARKKKSAAKKAPAKKKATAKKATAKKSAAKKTTAKKVSAAKKAGATADADEPPSMKAPLSEPF